MFPILPDAFTLWYDPLQPHKVDGVVLDHILFSHNMAYIYDWNFR